MPSELDWDSNLVEKFWDGLAKTDLSDLAFGKLVGGKIIKIAKQFIPENSVVLDFGCGDGDFVECLLNEGYKVAGYEPSLMRKRKLVERFVGRTNFVGVVDDLNAKSYDVVVAMEVIEHVLDVDFESVIAKLAALVRPGGVLIVTTPNNKNLRYSKVYCPVSDVLFHPMQHVRSFTGSQVEQLFIRHAVNPVMLAAVDFSTGAEVYDKYNLFLECANAIDALIKEGFDTPVAEGKVGVALDEESNTLGSVWFGGMEIPMVSASLERLKKIGNLVDRIRKIKDMRGVDYAGFCKGPKRGDFDGVIGHGNTIVYVGRKFAGEDPKLIDFMDRICADIYDGRRRVVGWGTPRHLPFLLTRSPFEMDSVIDGFANPDIVEKCMSTNIIPPQSLGAMAPESTVVALLSQEKHWPDITSVIKEIGDYPIFSYDALVRRYQSHYGCKIRRALAPEWVTRFKQLLSLKPRKEPCADAENSIALCVNGLGMGGAERQIVLLALGLRKLGWKVDLIAVDPDIPEAYGWAQELMEAGVNRHYIPDYSQARSLMWRYFNEGSRLKLIAEYLLELFKEDSVFIIVSILVYLESNPSKALVTYLDNTNIMASTAAVLAGIPSVHMSCRSVGPNNFPHHLHYCVDKSLLHDAYNVLLLMDGVSLGNNTLFGAHSYANWLGLSQDAISVVPNAVSILPKRRSIDVRSTYSIPTDSPLILGIMRFSEEKQPLVFVQVVSDVMAKLFATRAILVGDGPMRPDVERMIDRHGLTDRILLVGLQDFVGDFIEAADLLLLTSRIEGMPNVILEAQAHGRPVVAMDVGGVGEAMTPVLKPFLCPLGDMRGLAEKCLRLLSDRHSAVALGAEAAKDILMSRSDVHLAENTLNALGLDSIDRGASA